CGNARGRVDTDHRIGTESLDEVEVGRRRRVRPLEILLQRGEVGALGALWERRRRFGDRKAGRVRVGDYELYLSRNLGLEGAPLALSEKAHVGEYQGRSTKSRERSRGHDLELAMHLQEQDGGALERAQERVCEIVPGLWREVEADWMVGCARLVE